ncbi:MAG: aminotransferase class V-fold PLP-dependent enzyme [Betaproteobacteria bacterium]|nr:aminotransferase class V-fold PLP-dependent enzyme [Betaproteobacteria bacterium]
MIEGPLTEQKLRQHLWPRFARTRAEHPGIYLANHSLGRPPDRMAVDVAHALDAWYRDLGGAWTEWTAAREKFCALTAQLVGAKRADCIIPKTSAGQGLRAVLNALEAKQHGKLQVLTTDGEFDSLDFILRVYREKGRIDLRLMPWRELSVGNADLVVLSSVMFRSGERIDNLGKLTRTAHAAGALVLLDVYHHAGALPLDLTALEVDFAVGGSYKYLRGGPGACWLYVRPGLVETMRTLDTGWFAKHEPFSYQRPDPPRYGAGGDAWLESTPPMLTPVQALAGLEVTLELGVERLRAYSLGQKQLLADLLAARQVPTEGAGEEHGAFLTVTHPEAARLAEALAGRGVKTDARGDKLRLCPDILNAEAELAQAAEELGALLGR